MSYEMTWDTTQENLVQAQWPPVCTDGERLPLQWIAYKAVVEEWLDQEPHKKLKELVEHMKETYGFSRSVSAWKKKLREWDLRRNLSKTDVAHILKATKNMNREGSEIEVLVRNRRKTAKNIQTFLRKARLTEEEVMNLVDDQTPLPEYISVQIIQPSIYPTSMPFSFEHSLEASETLQNMRMDTLTTSDHPTSDVSDWQARMTNFDQTSSVTLDHLQNSSTSGAGIANAQIDEDSEFDSEDAVNVNEGPMHDEPEADWIIQSQSGLQTVAESASLGLVVAELMQPQGHSDETGATQLPYALMSLSPLNGALAEQKFLAQNNAAAKMTQGRSQPISLGPQTSLSTYTFSTCSSNFLAKAFHSCMLESQGSSTLAKTLMSETMNLFRDLLRDEAAECLATLHLFVAFLDAHGQGTFAKDLLEQATDISSSDVGPNAPLTVSIYFMACVEGGSASKSPGCSVEKLRMVYQQISSAPGENTPSALTALYHIGWKLTEEKKYDEARATLSALRMHCEACFGPNQIQTVTAITTLARVAYYQDKIIEANELIQEAINRLNQVYGDFYPCLLEARYRQAKFLFKMNEPERAERILRDVIRERFGILGSQNPRTQESLLALEEHLVSSGRSQEAQEIFSTFSNQNQEYNGSAY